jgi:hypothetical protein
VTGKHRFYMACDDYCFLKVGKTPNIITDAVELLNVNSYAPDRDYFRDYNDGRKRISAWVDLVKGQHYYLETDT